MGLISLYDRSPTSLQHAAVSVLGWRHRRQRLGSDFRHHLLQYERQNSSIRETLLAQDSLLRQSLALAVEAPAFQGVEDASALERFPLTSSSDVREHSEVYLLSHPGRVVERSTGGSTGTPLKFFTTPEAIAMQWAVWWRYRRWHGLELNTWCGHFGGRTSCPPGETTTFWRYNVPGRQVMFSTRHLSSETVGLYVAEINRRKLKWLHGLPSTISLLTSLMENAGLTFARPLRWVTFGSENVAPGTVERIERVHGVVARQHYGLAEGVANLSECPSGRLHVDEDFSYVEFLPYGHAMGSGDPQLFRVVGTSFTNRAQAFVRYDTGDLVSGLADGCECGRPGRTVAAVDGRTASYAQLPSGARVGPMSHVFRGLDGVVQGQVFVTSTGELTVHVVPGPGYDDGVAAELIRRIGERAPETVVTRVAVRASLVRGANGKVPVVIQGDPPPPDVTCGEDAGARISRADSQETL